MSHPNENSSTPSRREFLKASSLAVAGSIAMPYISTAQNKPSGTLKVGLVGCGGRGTGAASQALNADKNVILTAVADAFSEKAESAIATLKNEVGDKVQVEAKNQFVGLDAYQKVIDSGVDVVILATPPGFRPMHFKAAVDANKHIFIEKPMATDAAGVRDMMKYAAEAKKKNLAVVAGYCWRYDHARREFFKRVHDGVLGDIRAIYSTYYTGPVKSMPSADKRKPGTSDLEWMMRNWYNFTWLSGDGLVEQAIHSVDKILWAMKDVPPLKAIAVGGRQIPANGGNIFDHFEVNYEFAGGVRAFMGCRQQTGCYNQNADYVMGSKGVGTIGVQRTPEITIPLIDPKNSYWKFSGESPDMYQTEHNEFFASIRSGKHINDCDRMLTSTLAGIMGRMAAYTGQEVTWEQALNSQERLVPEKFDWDMKIEVPPTAMPGITKLI